MPRALASVPRTDPVPAAAAAGLRRRVLLPVDVLLLGVLLAVGALRLLGGSIPLIWQLLPFAVSLVVLGLPHGALDHLVPGRLAGRPSWWRPSGRVLALYALLGGADLMLWIAAPAAAFVLFIAITWFHWGQGDVWSAVALEGEQEAPRSARAARLLVRGAIPMLVPLLAFPAVYADVAAGAAGALGSSDGADWSAALHAPPLRIVAALTLGALVLVDRVLDRPRGRPRRWWATTAETALLLAFFAVVPPILAVGLYFCGWHALRHVIRLQLLDPPSARAFVEGPRTRPWVRFALAAAPATAAALLLLAALAIPRRPDGGIADLGVYLVLIAALTLPHVGVVVLMDRRQAVWRRTPPRP